MGAAPTTATSCARAAARSSVSGRVCAPVNGGWGSSGQDEQDAHRADGSIRPRPATQDIARPHARQSAAPAHRQRGSGRRGGREPQAHGPRRPRAPARRRHLRVPAGRLARHAEDRADHPRGDGRHRLPGDAHAGHAAGGDLAGERPLGRHRRRDVPPQGPQGRRHGARHDARRGRHLARRAGGPQLQAAPADVVPLPDQGARRGAAQERHPAHARVHHEGLLQPRRERRGAAGELPPAHRRLRPHLRALRRRAA